MTNQAVEIIGADRPSRLLITGDHASNRVPLDVNGGDLGLPAKDMDRHIAYDIGTRGVVQHLANLMGAPAILSRFSRLVIDPNRGEDDPTMLMRLYDGTIIPGNRYADAVEKEYRAKTYHRPYHAAYAELAARRDDTVIVAIHSFTPRLNGGALRPWHIGLLYEECDQRLSRPMFEHLSRDREICVGANVPYSGHLPGDAADRHGMQKGRPNVLVEVRQDLIRDEAGQREWAERLAVTLTHVLEIADF